MSHTPLLPPRGDSATTAAYTGPAGSITVNTTVKTIHVHDGETLGGIALSKVGHEHAQNEIIASLGFTPLDVAVIGQNNGVAPLGADGLIPVNYIPGNVGGVSDAADLTGNTLAANVLASSLTSVGVLTALSVVGTIEGNIETADKLATARALGVTGDATGSTSFDGSGDTNIALTLANVNGAPVTAGFAKVTTNAKGLVIATTAVVDTDITGALGFVPVSQTYVDDVAAGMVARGAVRSATTAALTATYNNGTAGDGATLTGTGSAPSMGGVTPALDDRVLVKNQAAALQNGPYKLTQVNPWVLTRADDVDTMTSGSAFYVEEGTLQGSRWGQLTVNPTVGTTAIEYTQLQGGSTLTQGTGISISNNVVSNTGVVSLAGTTNQVNVSAANGAVTVSLPASPTVSGTFTAAAFSGSGAALTALNASNLSSGTVPTARLGSGTANSTTFLAGDGTWKTVATGTSNALTGTGSITRTTGTAGVYIGVDNASLPLIMISNPAAASGSRAMQSFIDNSGSYVNAFANDVPNSQINWMKVDRSGMTATLITFNASAMTINAPVTATSFTGTHSGNGTNLVGLNASNISSGTVALARLGSGTPSVSNFLAGDGTWKTPTATVVSATGAMTFSTLGAADGIYIARRITVTGPPSMYFTQTTSAVDARMWRWQTSDSSGNGVLVLQTVTDIDNAATNVLVFSRSGLTPTTAAFNAAVSANSFSGVGTALTALNASNLTSGTVGTARLGSGTANSTTYLRGDGTWATVTTSPTTLNATGAVSVATPAASTVIAGQPVANVPTLAFYTTAAASGARNSYIQTLANGVIAWSLANDAAGAATAFMSVNRSGNTATNITFTSTAITLAGAVTGTSFSGVGTSLTALNASNLGSGTVPTARLGSGTADNTTYLRGDGTWATLTATAADAGTLTGTTLAANVVTASLATIQPPVSTVGAGGTTLSLIGGNANPGGNGVGGGTVSLLGGAAAGIAPAGAITIAGGVSSIGTGGSVSIAGGGSGGSSGVGGTVTIAGGNIGGSGGSTTPGAVSITGGSTSNGGPGGASVTISGGASASTTNAGGNAVLRGGLNSAAGGGGSVIITTGGSAYTERLQVTSAGEWKLAGNGGTAGQVLTSAGPGAAPTWSDSAGGSGTSLAATASVTPSVSTTTGAYAAVGGSGPYYILTNASATAAARSSHIQALSTGNIIWTLDSDNFSSNTPFLIVARSGNTASSITFAGTAIALNGAVTATSIAGTHSGDGAALTNLNASNLASGTVGTARMGSGTADNTTYLRGDGTWATVSGSAGTSLSATTQPTTINAPASKYVSIGVSSGGLPLAQSSNSTAAANNRLLLWQHENSGEYAGYLQNDAINVATKWFSLTRSGTTASAVTFTANAVNLSGLSTGLQLNGAAGTAGQALISNGPSAAPTWQTVSAAATVLIATSNVTLATTTGVYAGVAGGGTTATLGLANSAAPADNRISYIQTFTSGSLGWSLANDAVGAATQFMGVTRSGNTASLITFTSTGVNLAVGTAGLQLNGSAGTTGQALISNGAGAAPTWQAVTATTLSATSTALAPSATTATTGVYASSSGAQPTFWWTNSGGAANTKMSVIDQTNAGLLSFKFVNDAWSSSTSWLAAQRVAGSNVASAVTLTGTAINLAVGTSGLQLNGAAGTAGHVLTSNGNAAAPTWQAITVPAATTLAATAAQNYGTLLATTGTYIGTRGTTPAIYMTNNTSAAGARAWRWLALDDSGSCTLRLDVMNDVDTAATGMLTFTRSGGAPLAMALTGAMTISSGLTVTGTTTSTTVTSSAFSGSGTTATSYTTPAQSGGAATAAITVKTGDNTGGNSTGALTLGTGTTNSGAATSGAVSITSGGASAGLTTGAITIASGNGGGGGPTGNVTLTTGNSTTAGGTTGNIVLTTGTGASTSGYFAVQTASTERLRILPAGAWSVGTGGAATGTAGQVLQSNGNAASPSWVTPSVPALNATGTLTFTRTTSGVYAGLAGGPPNFIMVNSSAAADQKLWARFVDNSGTLTTQAQQDGSTTGNIFQSITRTGTVPTTWTTNAGNMVFTGLSTGATAAGGNSSITAAPGGSTSGVGGNLTLAAGNAGGGGVGGNAIIRSGNGIAAGAGGAIQLLAGTSGATSGAGGLIQITSGMSGTVGAASGAVTINSGNGFANNGVSGNVSVTTGNCTGASPGTMNISTGTTAGANGGGVNIFTGQVTSSGTSGSINIYTGSGATAVGTVSLRTDGSGGDGVQVNLAGDFYPIATVATQNLGLSTNRFDTVFLGTAPNVSSDSNYKQDILPLEEAELAVARKIKTLFKKYRMKDAVAAKGAAARIHIGVIAQEVQAAFQEQGLDAGRYALFCSDTWYEVNGSVKDEDGVSYTAESVGAVEVTRLSIRYEELLAFVIAAM